MRIASRVRVAAVLALAAVAGCATDGGSPHADVKRFYLSPQIARGSVFVEPADPAYAGSLQYQSIRQPVAAELARVDFPAAPDRASADLVAVVSYQRGLQPRQPGASPVSIGLGAGGSSGGYRGGGVGGGVGLGFNLGGHRNRDIAVDTLSLSIRRRSDASVIWEGSAVAQFRADSPRDGVGQAGPFLAHALLADFPGVSGTTVRVAAPK